VNSQSRVVSFDVSESALYGPASSFTHALIVLLIAAAIATWLLVARSAFIQEDDMDQPNRVGQLYGYAVCLTAILIGVVTVPSIIHSAMTLASPGEVLQSEYFQPSLTSFEAYLATRDRERGLALPSAAPPTPDTLSRAELRARYEVLRSDKLGRELQGARHSLISSVILLALAIGLFVVHWRWLNHPATLRRSGAT
jgi:hypothetical protein